MDKKRMRGNFLLMLTAFIWGTSFVSQSLGMESIEPFTFNCIRNIIAGLFLILCIKFLDKINAGTKPPETKEEKKYLLKGGIACGIVLFVASSLQQFGILYTSVGKAGRGKRTDPRRERALRQRQRPYPVQRDESDRSCQLPHTRRG